METKSKRVMLVPGKDKIGPLLADSAYIHVKRADGTVVQLTPGLLQELGFTIEEIREPLKVSGTVVWKEGGPRCVTYPAGDPSNIPWQKLIGKRGTLTFVEDAS